MKQYFICFSLMMKRVLRKPAFLIFLLLIPICAIGMNLLEQEKQSGVVIGVAIENAAWQDSFWKLLQEQDGILEFQSYENSEMLIQAVKKEELDCGFVLPEDLVKRVQEKNWQESIILYESSASTMTEFAKERIASAIFTIYAEESYVNYMEQSEVFAAAEKNGVSKEEITAFAQEAYQSHLMDGSTFAFQYQEENMEVEKGISESERQEPQERFPVRGVLAVCIFLSGMCGLLFDWEDRREKRFVRIAPNWLTTLVNIWIPTIYTSVMTLVALGLTAKLENIGKEILSLLAYQFLVVLYCSIIRVILRKQETVAVAIPILTIASIICCPVWIRLALYLPVFRILEKLFPVTYYLMM